MSANRPTTLSKSRFKLGLECRQKLFYTGKEEYANTKNENEFLQALAKGGFQVGELAKLHYPGGVDLKDVQSSSAAVQRTLEEIRKGTRILFEAAFQYGSLLIRADIVEITPAAVRLIEVKAKSYRSSQADFFNVKRTDIDSDFKPYLHDLAFQKYVIENAIQLLPELKGREVVPYLMLTDKSKQAVITGMQTHFKIERKDRGYDVKITPGVTLAALGGSVLTEVSCKEEVNFIFDPAYRVNGFDVPFIDTIHQLEKFYNSNSFSSRAPHKDCGMCEFRNDDPSNGLRSGFHECHAHVVAGSVTPKTFTYELWGGGKPKLKGQLIGDGEIFLENIPLERLEPDENAQVQLQGHDDARDGWNYQKRHIFQQQLLLNPGVDYCINNDYLDNQMKSWEFPWHMIDFETSAPPIPFFKGLHPYQPVAFQFSHHIVEADGSVRHENQYIEITPGLFPNFDFVRALMKAIGTTGTVFRYATHENTILNEIKGQLILSAEPDKQVLIDFIDTITYSGKGKSKIRGHRCMVDLRDVVLKSFIHRDMKGSNSLKYVLPAIIRASPYLQDKYSAPVYGNGIPSLNYSNKIWVTRDAAGKIIDPYKTLDTVLNEYDEVGNALEQSAENEEYIDNGGVAMMAWSEVQFQDTAPQRVSDIQQALLEYCELDTLAMVMLVEGLRELK